MAAISPKPSLVPKALAKGQTLASRLQALVPTTTTVFSPTTVYAPAGTPGGELSAPSTALPNIAGWYGTWTAPDLNNGQPYDVQVECFGAGGGGGGGINNAGGGGGGGGGYSCEPNYIVSPNVTYTYLVGLPGAGGLNNSSGDTSGTAGGDTIFDIAGISIPTGVHAFGGQPGDIGSAGIGGPGGLASSNTLSYAGGMGGTNVSGLGSDDPTVLATISGMFQQNTLKSSIIEAWYVLNDYDNTAELNDNTGRGNVLTDTNYTGTYSRRQGVSPAQVPAYNGLASGSSWPNNYAQGSCGQFVMRGQANPAARLVAKSFPFSGKYMTVSAWVQCDPSGTWGYTVAGATAYIAVNSQYAASDTAVHGYGLTFTNQGTSGSPLWQLSWSLGNGVNGQIERVTTNLPATPGQWHYVVGVWNNGTATLYVDSVNKGTSSHGWFTSVNSGVYPTTLGLNADSANGVSNWFFGYMSSVWFANDAATSTLVNQVYASTSPTAGSGGASSASPGGTGNNGSSGAGAVGGAKGTAVAIPVNLSGFTTAGGNGVNGSNAAAGVSQTVPAGPGSGGGGSGDMAASPALFTLTIPFASAASYCGPDATGGNAGAVYNSNQQITPGLASSGVLFAGGQASDPGSGSKNTMMLLPAGLAKTLGSGQYTIQQVSVTFTNALQSNTAETILEMSYSADSSLPASYLGASVVEYIGAALIPSGSDTITYDLTQSKIGTHLANGTATAILLGPTDNPTFDAYNAVTATDFYCAIYGVGATDTGGNSLAPYLTIVLQETLTTQAGGPGGPGLINITSVDQGTPIATIQPFAATDGAGNQSAAGYTGNAIAYNPMLSPPNMAPESWHTFGSYGTGFAASGGGYNGLWYRILPDGDVMLAWDMTATTSFSNPMATLPSQYWPGTSNIQHPTAWSSGQPTSYSSGWAPFLSVTTVGGVALGGSVGMSATMRFFGTWKYPPQANL
jgi:hypothetical protein